MSGTMQNIFVQIEFLASKGPSKPDNNTIYCQKWNERSKIAHNKAG